MGKLVGLNGVGREMTKRRVGRFSCRVLILSLMSFVLIVPAIIPISNVEAQPRSQWTFMVYLDADNNLDSFAYQNVDDMMTVGSTRNVNIVVLWDKYDDVANLYEVKSDELDIVRGFALNGEEANMGDPDTLRSFVKFTMRSFRASHYVLVLWDHGDDFSGCCWDDHTGDSEVPEDHLTHQEIAGALSGVELDILAFDTCVEGMIEVVYEYACYGSQIDYVVATEGYVPYSGYPYSAVLNALAANSDMDSSDLSMVMVDEYIAYYDSKRPASRLVQMGAIDMTYVDLIVEQLGSLTDVLEEGLLGPDSENYHGWIAAARGAGNMGWSEYGWEAYVDLPTFANTLGTFDFHEATIVYETLKDAVYSKASWAMKSAEGMGIFFPSSYASFYSKIWWNPEDYLAMQFPYEGFWAFLQTYWGK